MADRIRMVCGNDPTVTLTAGDQQAIDDFAAWLKAKAEGRTASAEQDALFATDPPAGEMTRTAVISACGAYRYRLERSNLQPLPDGPPIDPDRTATFLMLNPSTADAAVDDPTIRRCLTFARAWGCGRLLVVNLYALRSTDPAALWRSADPVGPDNDKHLAAAAAGDGPLIAAWGANAKPERIAAVLALPGMDRLNALALTKTGQPRHPLYLPGGLTPQPWRQP